MGTFLTLLKHDNTAVQQSRSPDVAPVNLKPPMRSVFWGAGRPIRDLQLGAKPGGFQQRAASRQEMEKEERGETRGGGEGRKPPKVYPFVFKSAGLTEASAAVGGPAARSASDWVPAEAWLPEILLFHSYEKLRSYTASTHIKLPPGK
ncbi:uncharacterized protein ACB058_020157 [Synchiropus picturatus]